VRWFVLQAESWSGSEWQVDSIGHYEADSQCIVESAYNEPHLQPVVVMKKLTNAQYALLPFLYHLYELIII